MTPAEKILAALKNREFILHDGEFYNRCRTCNNAEHEGHAPDCEYAEAIREAEKLVKESETLVPCKKCGSTSQEIFWEEQYIGYRCIGCGSKAQPSYYVKDCGMEGMGDMEIARDNWNKENS